MAETTKVRARIVKRRTPTFPSRISPYYDCTPWGGGFIRATNNGPGAVVLNNKGEVLNLQTGEVYTDDRFHTPNRGMDGGLQT